MPRKDAYPINAVQLLKKELPSRKRPTRALALFATETTIASAAAGHDAVIRAVVDGWVIRRARPRQGACVRGCAPTGRERRSGPPVIGRKRDLPLPRLGSAVFQSTIMRPAPAVQRCLPGLLRLECHTVSQTKPGGRATDGRMWGAKGQAGHEVSRDVTGFDPCIERHDNEPISARLKTCTRYRPSIMSGHRAGHPPRRVLQETAGSLPDMRSWRKS